MRPHHEVGERECESAETPSSHHRDERERWIRVIVQRRKDGDMAKARQCKDDGDGDGDSIAA